MKIQSSNKKKSNDNYMNKDWNEVDEDDLSYQIGEEDKNNDNENL